MQSILWCTLLAGFFTQILGAQVSVIHAWKNLVFGFDSQEQEDYAIAKGLYSPNGQKRPYGGDMFVHDNGSLIHFLSMPRVGRNIPFTLATIDDTQSTTNGPVLRAFPSMDLHLERSCSGFFAVFRIFVDQICKRLWVIDSGRDFFAGAKTQICPPKIIAIDLMTNKIVIQHIIPADQYIPEVSIFNSITLHPNRACDNSIAYVTDARGPGLVVFNLKKNLSWKTENDFYKADPQYYPVTIAGETFNFTDGLYTVAPDLVTNKLYFHGFASISEYSVPMPIINIPIFWKIKELPTHIFFHEVGKRPTQSGSQAVDSRGNLWFALLDPLAIVCWNPVNPYDMKHFKIVTVDEENLQFVADLKFREHPTMGDTLIGLSNQLQRHNTGTVNPNEINYRLFHMAIEGIDCINV